MPANAPTHDAPALLLHFAGPDRLGLTAALTQALAAFDLRILDIGQAVVHENVGLGFLVELPPTADLPTLRAALKTRAAELGLTLRCTPVPPSGLHHWMDRLPHQRFIVTLLGRSLTAAHLMHVSQALADCSMNIDRIDRLSGQLAPADPAHNACVEMAIRGDLAHEQILRTRFLALAQELSIDIACQRDSIFRRHRRLFAFDMDSTLIQAEVIDELARMAGVGDQVSRITEAAMRGELNFDESFTRRLGLLKGLPADRVYSLIDTIPLADGAERLIRTLHFLGYKTAILSGGFDFFAHALQRRFGIDHVHSNQLEIVDGKVTGRVLPPIMNGARKAEMLTHIAAQEGISLEQVVAVGDGANDIPMLTLAGMGIAYRAKPIVRQKAQQSISALGLDGLLYLLGLRDRDLLHPTDESLPAHPQ